jgi:monovalent cation:H+ antiporter-2, CPA2 family
VLEHLDLPFLVVELDAEQAEKMQDEGIQTLFGDAANSEVLTHAGLDHARALIVTVSNEASAELIVAGGHTLAPALPIIARAGTESGIERLAKHGARHVIHPELEGGLEIVRHALMVLDYPMTQIQQYVDAVRGDAYKAIRPDHEQHPVLDQLISAVRGVDIAWQPVSGNSPILGKSLAEANLRANIGASVIALIRNKQVLPNPKSDTRFTEGDLVGLIGNPDELADAEKILNPQEHVMNYDTKANT